jgi:hypothetical protein
VSLLARLLLGDGTLKPEMKEALAVEGLVLVEENLRGSVRYKRFRAPGRYHHGKVTAERMGIGVSEKRFVVYCRGGRVKLIDSEYTNPRLEAMEVALKDDDAIAFRVDYDRMGEPGIRGEVTIVARTPNAARIADHVKARSDLL